MEPDLTQFTMLQLEMLGERVAYELKKKQDKIACRSMSNVMCGLVNQMVKGCSIDDVCVRLAKKNLIIIIQPPMVTN